MLCKKIVNFFSLLSHTHEAGSRKMGISQELLSLVTGLAHYLKLLIRIALGGALKLEREHQNHSAIHQFLTRLDQLARDPEAAKATFTLPSQPEQSDQGHSSASSPTSSAEQPPVYGYQSLSRAVGTLIGQGEATSDLCEACKGSVEEECVRFGTSLRWHFACLKCVSCNASAGRKESASSQPTPEPASQVYPPSHFRFEPKPSTSHESNGVTGRQSSKSGRVICVDCVSKTRALETKEGFAHVTRLEQYAFLLCVALNKLYGLLKSKGVMQPSASGKSLPRSPAQAKPLTNAPGKSSIPEGLQEETRSLYETYRDSAEIKRMKSVNLDRKLSATVRTPKKSTVIDGPAGKSGQVLADQKEKVPSTLPRASSENLTRTQPQPLSLPTNTRDRSATVAAQSLPQEGKPPRPPPLDPQKAAAYGLTPVERPAYNRSQSAVRVVDDDDTPLAQHREDLKLKEAARNDQDGLTLADLPHAMAHEQALKEQQRQDGRKQKPVSPRHAQFLSELSALEYMLVKHAATLMLPAEDSPFRDIASQEELVDLVEMRKNNFWSKFFKPQDNKKSVKKKGVFGIPLEFLVEREGVESMLGAGAAPLRVPTFVDEVVSAMKQMGKSDSQLRVPSCLTPLVRHVGGRRVPQKWQHQTTQRLIGSIGQRSKFSQSSRREPRPASSSPQKVPSRTS